jgi:hypothetical protein
VRHPRPNVHGLSWVYVRHTSKLLGGRHNLRGTQARSTGPIHTQRAFDSFERGQAQRGDGFRGAQSTPHKMSTHTHTRVLAGHSLLCLSLKKESPRSYPTDVTKRPTHTHTHTHKHTGEGASRLVHSAALRSPRAAGFSSLQPNQPPPPTFLLLWRPLTSQCPPRPRPRDGGGSGSSSSSSGSRRREGGRGRW